MMTEASIDLSIIIPHRDTPKLLNRLLDSIPLLSNIEVIVVDNSVESLQRTDLTRSAIILYSDLNGGAGRARNIGIDAANGRWLLFADADDYFVEDAFNEISNYTSSLCDIIYFEMESINDLTGEWANRGDLYTRLVQDYLQDARNELNLRLRFDSPCSKLISKAFIEKYKLRYDECVTANDVFFSISSGYFAKSVQAVSFPLYVATESSNSLTKRADYVALKSRLLVQLKVNSFFKKNGLPEYQQSVAYYLYKSFSFGPHSFFQFLFYVLKAKQNPFVGYKNWIKTLNKNS